MNNNEQNYAEISVSVEQLQNMPESSSAYFVKNGEGEVERAKVVGKIMELVCTMAEGSLTPRQKVILHLCFQERRSQVEIAGILGISPVSVNHHLIGQMKRGKPVGGAIQKMRKIIRKAAMQDGGTDISNSQYFTVLNDMLDESMTRRAMACHIINLFQFAKSNP